MFLLVIIASSINITVEARDVLLLYASIGQVQFTISSMALRTNATNFAAIMIQFHSDNPVDYGGLKATQISVSAIFTASNSSIFKENPLIWGLQIDRPLAPHSSDTWNFAIVLNTQNATALSSFYQTHNRMINADTSFDIVITTTFLHSFAGSFLYQKEQNVTLT